MFDVQKIYRATSVEDAIRALHRMEGSILISGGSDVLIKIREGKLAGCTLVSINDLQELTGIVMEEDGTIKIGPGETFTRITEHPLIRQHIPVLGHAVDQAGGPQLRNVATIGGNVCNGVTSADSAGALLVLGAQLEITGRDGMRTLPLEQFYKGPGRVDLNRGEILTAIRIPQKDYQGFGGHYIKYAQRAAMDIATLGCAVSLRLEEDRQTIADYRLAFGVAAPTPIRCRKTEAAVMGKPVSSRLLEEIGQLALGEVSPRTSWRASKEFRQRLVCELSGRATAQAVKHAGGETL